jgi:hypothetical protein
MQSREVSFMVRMFLVTISMLTANVCFAGDHSALGDSTTSCIAVDAGFYPTQGHVGVGWYPSYAVRISAGQYNSVLSWYVCIDYYDFKLSESGGLYGFVEQGALRRDIAVYPAVTLYRFLFVGVGAFYTHSDHVTTTSIFGRQTWNGGDVEGLRYFLTIGLMWDFQITGRISIPVGLHYRNPSYNSDTTPLAFRVGVSASIW